MANRDGHRRFGNVRMRESGRFQIRYPGPDGRMRTGPETYERKGDAERALVLIEAQIARVSGPIPSAPRSGWVTTPRRGSLSGRVCVPARRTFIGGCWASTSRRTWAASR